MKEVKLEEILSVVFDPCPQDCTTPTQDLQLAITLNPDLTQIKSAMREACRQVLELASENATVIKKSKLGENGIWKTEYVIIKDSITNTINQVK